MRSVFGEHDVAGELPRREPEREIGNVVQLELGVDPEGQDATGTKKGGETGS